MVEHRLPLPSGDWQLLGAGKRTQQPAALMFDTAVRARDSAVGALLVVSRYLAHSEQLTAAL